MLFPMRSATIKLLTWLISMLGLAATFGIASYASVGLSWAVSSSGILLFAWAVLPYGLVAMAANLTRSKKGSIAVLVVAAISLLFAGLVYVDAFFIHSDAQSALAFIFVPLVQNAVAIIVLGVVIFS